MAHQIKARDAAAITAMDSKASPKSRVFPHRHFLLNPIVYAMVHLPELIQDLALILAAAGFVTILFRKLRQPVVLGYIIAGLLVGPHFPFLPTITDLSSIKIWAEIGVIFLLFALGLEFSFKKLFRVGGAATVTALFEIVFMVVIGFATGQLFGWSKMDSVFLGGVLAISSTTIIIRAFDELGVKGRGFAGLVFGVLIIEDLVAILLLVLLSTLAISQTFAGTEMMVSVVKLIFFLTLWFVSGIFLLPTFLERASSLLSEETLLVVSVGLCLAMVVLATHAGFSPALGAFIMGSILAETRHGEKIEHLVKPVKDLFGAVFFVSVGMMIDPKILSDYAVPVLVIAGVTIVGKTLSTMLGALVAGQSLKRSIYSGLSLAQIGEFSFIIAGLGLTLKVTSEFLYPVAVGVSALTTFTTPYMIKSSDSVYQFVERHLRKSWLEGIAKYSAASRSISARSDWGIVLRSYMVRIGLNSVLIAAVFLGVANYMSPFFSSHLDSRKVANAAGLITALILASPFLWALVLGKSNQKITSELWRAAKYRGPLFAIEASRWAIALVLVAVLSTQFVTLKFAVSLFLTLTIVFVFMFSRHLAGVYTWIENRFVKNLAEKDGTNSNGDPLPHLAPWDAHLVRLEVPPESAVVGKTLAQLSIREKFGITVALIERGQNQVAAPNRDEWLFPHDRVLVIGTDEQISEFKSFLETNSSQRSFVSKELNYSLHPYLVSVQSPFLGRSIRESGIREQTHGLVVGIERGGKRILNPDSNVRIENADLLWIVGDAVLLKSIPR